MLKKLAINAFFFASLCAVSAVYLLVYIRYYVHYVDLS